MMSDFEVRGAALSGVQGDLGSLADRVLVVGRSFEGALSLAAGGVSNERVREGLEEALVRLRSAHRDAALVLQGLGEFAGSTVDAVVDADSELAAAVVDAE